MGGGGSEGGGSGEEVTAELVARGEPWTAAPPARLVAGGLGGDDGDDAARARDVAAKDGLGCLLRLHLLAALYMAFSSGKWPRASEEDPPNSKWWKRARGKNTFLSCAHKNEINDDDDDDDDDDSKRQRIFILPLNYLAGFGLGL
jgi:hypothetical protein